MSAALEVKRAMQRCAEAGWLDPDAVEAATVEVLKEIEPSGPGVIVVALDGLCDD